MTKDEKAIYDQMRAAGANREVLRLAKQLMEVSRNVIPDRNHRYWMRHGVNLTSKAEI